MAIYTFIKKSFGRIHAHIEIGNKQYLISILIGGSVGFYDGIFGPGTGSFLIFLFIRCFGFDFLTASAAAKIVNFVTNVAAITFFLPTGNVIYALVFPMAICNITGAYTGFWLATKYGSGFIRVLFLCLLVTLIIKISYDLYIQG